MSYRKALGLAALAVLTARCFMSVDENRWKTRDGRADQAGDALPRDARLAGEAGCPAGYTRCGAICAKLTADERNCGACNSRCPATTDRCVDGKCFCGPGGDPCEATLDCVAGICRCTHDGLCDGCCDGNTCVSLGVSQSAARCGKRGAACAACPTGQCISSTSCAAGVCQPTALPNTATCNAGRYCTVNDHCIDGSCGGDTRYCGDLDGACVVGECVEAEMRCVAKNRSNGTPCGQYCTQDHCGDGVCTKGSPRSCSSLDGQCVRGVCDEGTRQCVVENKPDTTKCNDGKSCTDPDTCTAGKCSGPAKPKGSSCGTLSECCGTECCGFLSECCPDLTCKPSC